MNKKLSKADKKKLARINRDLAKLERELAVNEKVLARLEKKEELEKKLQRIVKMWNSGRKPRNLSRGQFKAQMFRTAKQCSAKLIDKK